MTKKDYVVDSLLKWGTKNFKFYDWRNTNNKWHALVAEIMLQRTSADQVLPVYRNFCNKYISPNDYINSNEKIFKNLGLHWRESLLKKLAVVLSNKDIPTEKKELLKLPAIGDYIASAYRSLHLNKRDIIIDSNVVRIYGRFFGFKTHSETRRNKKFKLLSNRITPIDDHKIYNYALIDFTREICTYKPKCNYCIIQDRCCYRNY